MNLGLTFDLQTDPSDPSQAEFDPPRVIDALCAALESLGHRVARLGGALELLADPSRLSGLGLVFNIAEGADGRCREAGVPMLLERHGVPYVGSGPSALAAGLDKVLCKRLVLAAGLRTPAWCAVDRPAALPAELPAPFPLIVKPRYEGSGIGIDEGAIVHDRRQLVQRIEYLCERWRQPALVEAFLPDGELTVCVIGNDPPRSYPAIQRPLDPVTRLSCHVVRSAHAWEAPVELTPVLEAEAGRIALTMFDALGCRDMARVDLRVDRGEPVFLEINPLPTFDPEGSIGLLAECLSLTHAELIGRILDAAIIRLHRTAPRMRA